MQVVADWLLEYHRLVSGEATSLPRLQPERLTRRGRLNLLQRRFLRKLVFQPVALFGATKFLFRRTVPLRAATTSESVAGKPIEPYPNIQTRVLSDGRTRRLHEFAETSGLTVNDLLASALFIAISRWRERHAAQRDRDWIRLLIPLSIRTVADRRLTACNRVSFVQVDRQPRQIADGRELMRSVSRELRVIRQWELDRTLLIALRIASIIPGQLQRMARNSRNRATVLLTNLGNPFDRLPLERAKDAATVGNLKWRGVELIAPMLRGIPAAFAVAEFLNCLTICLNLDPRVLSGSLGAEMLDEFERAIGELMATG
jgi:hypothetical protein